MTILRTSPSIRPGVGPAQGAHRRLHAVGQEDDGRLLRLGRGPGIAEVLLFALLVLSPRSPGPCGRSSCTRVVPWCWRMKSMTTRAGGTAGQLHAVLHVAGDDQRAQVGRQLVVGILPAVLVLNEEVGPLRLADVVVLRAHPGQQAVAADRLRRRLGQVAHDHAVVVASPAPPSSSLRRRGWLGLVSSRSRMLDVMPKSALQVGKEPDGAHRRNQPVDAGPRKE